MEPLKAKPKPISYDDLKKSGLPVISAVFHDTITSRTPDHLPEFAMYAESAKKSRKAKMWYTPHGLLIEQEEGHKLIPLANVKDTNLA